jgi:hypothetical protein
MGAEVLGMPVLIIAVVFLLIFLVMGAMLFTAMVIEHKGNLFSGKWADQPKGVRAK